MIETKAMKKIIFLFFIILFANSPVLAEISNQVPDGKYKTVVYVLTSVLIGIFVFLFYLERKLSKLEKQIINE